MAITLDAVSTRVDSVSSHVDTTGSVQAMEAATTRRRTPSKGDRREQAILAGARALLEAKPLSQVTTDELAAAAGLSRSSFYFYFDSKSAVATALLDGLADELRAENGPWLEAAGPAEPELRQATAHSVALWRTHAGLLRQAWHCDTGDGQLAAWRAGLLERGTRRLAAKVERDRAAGLAPAGPPSAATLARGLHALRNDLLAEVRAPAEDAALVEDLVAITLRLLYGQVPAGAEAAGRG
jgi:AcrR family transcriptional regulator